MAKKIKEEAKAPVAAAKKAGSKKEEPVKGNGKKTMSEADKLKKREARKEALKNRPEGQRTNSKQVDVINFDGGSVETFAYPIRKSGSLVTSVLKNEDGQVIGVANTYIPGTKAKAKKGHGMVVPGVAGEGKKRKGDDTEEEEDED